MKDKYLNSNRKEQDFLIIIVPIKWGLNINFCIQKNNQNIFQKNTLILLRLYI